MPTTEAGPNQEATPEAKGDIEFQVPGIQLMVPGSDRGNVFRSNHLCRAFAGRVAGRVPAITRLPGATDRFSSRPLSLWRRVPTAMTSDRRGQERLWRSPPATTVSAGRIVAASAEAVQPPRANLPDLST
jgi:hypothetical protein